MKSIWSLGQDCPTYPPLDGDGRAQVAVIGGGMAGILTAYLLTRQGVDAAVLEAGRIGSGQTGCTTAKITSQHNLIYHKLLDMAGREQAEQYARANQRAIERYREIIEQEQISCDFEQMPAYLYSTGPTDSLEQELEAAQALGLPASFARPDTLPFSITGAVRFERQAQFDPLRFLSAVARPLRIYEQTRAIELEARGVRTDRGTLRADAVVVTTHFPIFNAPGYFFARMHQQRSYLLALRGAPQVAGMYLDIDPQGYSLRNAGDLLLLGGAGHRTGETQPGGGYAKLRRAAREFYPQCTEEAHWSAQDCMTLDGVPYIGRYCADTPALYVATGFQKWGMTSSMVAAQQISDEILGRENPDAEVFSPQRFHPAASVKNLLVDGAKAVTGIARERFSLPQQQADQVAPGQGCIIRVGADKIGVYRDEEGKLYAVSVQCPHLGCELAWNPEERSWDCPCHGSRFDIHGKLLDSPARADLHLKRELPQA